MQGEAPLALALATAEPPSFLRCCSSAKETITTSLGRLYGSGSRTPSAEKRTKSIGGDRGFTGEGPGPSGRAFRGRNRRVFAASSAALACRAKNHCNLAQLPRVRAGLPMWRSPAGLRMRRRGAGERRAGRICVIARFFFFIKKNARKYAAPHSCGLSARSCRSR